MCIRDRCIFFKQENDPEAPSIVILQVDDYFGLGTEKFLTLEQEKSRKFVSKPRKILEEGEDIRFIGSTMLTKDGSLTVHQAEKLSILSIPTTIEEASSVRASIQHCASVCRPDLCSQSQLLCSCLLYTSPSPRDQRGSRMPSSA